MSKTTTFAFDPDAGGLPAEEGDDVVFVFSGFKLNIEFFVDDEGFDEGKARAELESMAESVWIDRTYVAFKGTKFKNVFLKEKGWDELVDYVWSARKKRGAGWESQMVMRRSFEEMIAAYMDHAAHLLGYDPSRIEFSVDPESDIRVRLFKDTAREWKTYPGRWQDWPENN